MPHGETLQTCDDRREKVRARQPQVDRDILREPLRQRGLKSVEHGDGKGDRPQQAQYDQIESPQHVEYDARRREEQFEYPCQAFEGSVFVGKEKRRKE